MLHGVGIAWTQYKAMAAVALDWVQVDPYECVEDDEDSMYWLYDGYVHVHVHPDTTLFWETLNLYFMRMRRS